jgi:HAD superfamily hydrolase (TIGR01509 family)
VIPYHDIDTVFLDVGNTLISIDFDWVAAELSCRGCPATAAALRQAEAAARPGYSRALFVEGVEPGADLFGRYLSAIFAGLDLVGTVDAGRLAAITTELRAVLRPNGQASALWRSIMPGVPEALERLRALDLRLVVVSNSDGTAEQALEAAGLRAHLAAVVDSALVGFEKPDPRIFHHALALCGAEAARTLHVGDLYHADVLGAREAGLHAALLDPFGDWKAPDCACFPDLLAVAEAIGAARSS